MIVYGHIEGLYQEQEKEMLERIFLFDDLNVDSIMTPLEEIVWINSSDLNDKIIDQVIKSKFSRVPVYKDSKDNIQGVVIIKDLLSQMYHTKDLNIDIKDVIREPYIVLNTLKINRLLLDMKQRKEHLAFIMEESKEVLGIVTLEDIIEEIVGEIYDEHDK
ncbi:CBS domain-containing protein [Candidatus Izimaplasma bacterium]|nr:CBS domain-containing protein [Candidatus Izimaplasma bacterium]